MVVKERTVSRRSATGVLGTAFVLAGMVIVGGSGATASAAEPRATVSPSDGLLDGQVVTLTVTGLAPNEGALVFQCANATTDGTPIESGTRGACATPPRSAMTDSDGNLVVAGLVVHQQGLRNESSGFEGSCAAAGARFPCYVRVLSGGADLTTDLHFATGAEVAAALTEAVAPNAAAMTTSAAQAASPTMTVVPDRELSDGTSVTITGSGYPAISSVVAVQCGNADANGDPYPAGTRAEDGICGLPPMGAAQTDASGNVQITAAVKTTLNNRQSDKVSTCIEEGFNFPCFIMLNEASEGGAEARHDIYFGSSGPTTTAPAAGDTTTTTGGSSGATTTTEGVTGTSGSSTGAGSGSEELSNTGAESIRLAVVGSGLLVVGFALLLASRRRPAVETIPAKAPFQTGV